MSSAETARHALYSQLEEVLGRDHAETLMTHLPRHEHDTVATKSDIATLDTRFDKLDTRFDKLEARFDRMEDRLDRHQRFFVGTTFATLTAMTAIFSFVVTIIT